MPRSNRLLLKMALVGLLVGGGVAAAAWMQRERLQVWYAVHGLRTASGEDAERWVREIDQLGARAIPSVVDCLREPTPSVCANAAAALKQLGESENGAHSTSLCRQIVEVFPVMSGNGQKCMIELAGSWLASATPAQHPCLLETCACILEKSAAGSESTSRQAALTLVASVLKDKTSEGLTPSCRTLVGAALHDDDADVRLAALRMAFDRRIRLGEQTVALLKDPVATVRRAAMAEVGPLSDLVATDDLLSWLYDTDAEVRRVCELALRARGLDDARLRLGRLKASPDPRVRLDVLAKLPAAADVDQSVWLRSLSHDASPAVRAATIRYAAEQDACDLCDRLQQMGQNDPCPTVRQLAQYYLSCRKTHPRSSTGN